MSSRYILTKSAENDIDDIVTYITQDNANAAYDFIDALYDSFELLCDNPLMGYTREDITKHPIRFWAFKWHYLVVYLPDDPLKIVRVLSGFRDLSKLV